MALIKIFLKGISYLIWPFFIINMFVGIGSSIWLLIIGEWKIIVGGGIAFLFFIYIISFLFLPTMLLLEPAMKLIEGGKRFKGSILGFLAMLYTLGIITAWCLIILFYSIKLSDNQSLIPLLIFSYEIAVGPVAWLSHKDQQGGGNEYSLISTFLAEILYVISIIMILAGYTFTTVLVVFSLTMFIGAILQYYIALKLETSDY